MKHLRSEWWTWITSTMLAVLILVSACGPEVDQPAPIAGMTEAGIATTGMSAQTGSNAMPGMATDSAIHVTERQAALAGVTFAVARSAALERTVRAVAVAVPDERTLGVVNARTDGWVEKLYANETGRYVARGEALLELYAPQLVTAQEELLLAKRLPAGGAGDSLVAAARRRLELWNISVDQIAEIERTHTVRRTLTLRSPYRGHVLEKNVIEGQAVKSGDPLFRIADLSTIWIEPAIFERDIPSVGVGRTADVSFDAVPGRSFRGRVTFIYPTLDARTRTLRVRVEVPNPGLLIRPGMYGTVRIAVDGTRGVVVPLEAVLPTGEKDLAFVLRGGGIRPAVVTVSERGDNSLVVADGITAGDTVVASATFLFDSESSLAAAMKGIMLNMGMGLDMGGMQAGGDKP